MFRCYKNHNHEKDFTNMVYRLSDIGKVKYLVRK